jgi:hypothetical protein
MDEGSFSIEDDIVDSKIEAPLTIDKVTKGSSATKKNEKAKSIKTKKVAPVAEKVPAVQKKTEAPKAEEIDPEDGEVIPDADKPWTLTENQEKGTLEILSRFQKDLQRAQWLQANKGVGKTYMGTEVARRLYKEYGIEVVILCRPTLETMWRKFMAKAGVPIRKLITWNSLIGRRGKVISGKDTKDEVRDPAKVKHGYLTRENGETGPFKATQEWLNIARDGVLILCDESQAAKNSTSATHWATNELITTALAVEESLAFVLHLSAGIVSKETSYECLYRILNLTDGIDLMYKQDQRRGILNWKDYGLGGVFDRACRFNSQKTHSIFSQKRGTSSGRDMNMVYRIGATDVPEILRKLWEEVFILHYSVNVEGLTHVYADGTSIPIIRRNSFFEMTAEEATLVTAAVRKLRNAHLVRDDGGVDVQGVRKNMAMVQSCMMALAHSKVPAVLRATLKLLQEHPTCKILLGITFEADQKFLAEHLSLYHPLVLNGKVPIGAPRDVIVAKFNAPNLRHRVAIVTPEVAGVGLSFHDHIEPSPEDMKELPMFKNPQEAFFPRFTLAVPTFVFDAMDQLFGRTDRHGMRSPTTIIAVYVKNAPLESVLVNTMIKSNVAKGSLQDKKRIFPNEFDVWIENEVPEDKPLREMLEKMQTMGMDDLKKAK